jgi:hypothetical protein
VAPEEWGLLNTANVYQKRTASSYHKYPHPVSKNGGARNSRICEVLFLCWLALSWPAIPMSRPASVPITGAGLLFVVHEIQTK